MFALSLVATVSSAAWTLMTAASEIAAATAK
jgi:hypothetical protein